MSSADQGLLQYGGARAAAQSWQDQSSEPSFEVHRRGWLYLGMAFGSLLLAGGFGWLAWSVPKPWLWAICALFAALFLIALPGALSGRTPLFLADDQGIRMRNGRQWVGLLWSDIDGVVMEQRAGRHDPCIKVLASDGSRIYRTPVGLTTTVTVDQAEAALADHQGRGAY